MLNKIAQVEKIAWGVYEHNEVHEIGQGIRG